VTGSALFRGASFNTRGYDWGWVGGLGDTTLALVPNGLPAADVTATKAKIVSFADGLLTQLGTQGYPAPFATSASPYYWGSNGQVANNAAVLGLAHDFTGQQSYKQAAFGALDYLMGRNPLNQSYIAGFGEKAVSHLHHRFWANQSGLPAAPAGSLSGGPNHELQDPVAQAQLAGCKSQKCFIDDIGAYSVNEVAINWNSGLAWLANWAAEKSSVSPPVDTTAPTAPGQPAASEITTNSVRLTWPASSDPESGIAGYDVLRGTDASAVVVATPTSTTAVVSGLASATAYQFSVRARNGAGLVSALSPAVGVTTANVPVDGPPTTPGTPVASAVTSSGATLTWPASADDQGVAGYDVLRVDGATQTVVATPTSNTVTLSGLAANTEYTYAVRARDTSGQLSAVSPTVGFRTLNTPPPGGCRVVYSANSWSNGFTGNVTLTNTGATAWSSWTLSFTFTGGQVMTQGWSGRWSQTGSTVTVSNEAWNGSVPAGGSVSLGFNGSHTGTNPNPTVFTANGTLCG
jgi:endoglucanase